ncbi:MAG TPA: hypothetical protein HA224_00550 [Nanoarchaeota archaeon]|nr:hypothetical protein [Nanoarchaeota archaeon]
MTQQNRIPEQFGEELKAAGYVCLDTSTPRVFERSLGNDSPHSCRLVVGPYDARKDGTPAWQSWTLVAHLNLQELLGVGSGAKGTCIIAGPVHGADYSLDAVREGECKLWKLVLERAETISKRLRSV